MIQNPLRCLFSLFVSCLLFFMAFNVNAQQLTHFQMAQADTADDSYDPFSDYSEFDENSDEEADIHFFRTGRFFTVGLPAGMRQFTGNLGDIYTASQSYGLFISYFFDLRMAVQTGFLTGDHPLSLRTLTDKELTGKVSMTLLQFNIKYFFNTQTMIRSVADLSPHLLLGVSNNKRTILISDEPGQALDSAMSIDLGGGIEIPLMRKKAFIGVQAVYHTVTFKDENTPIVMNDGTPTNIKPSGNHYDVLAILGLNF